MLYLHFGWPKTGTTSLQASLVKHRDRLLAAGVLYPRTWRSKKENAHNELKKSLWGSVASAKAAVTEIAALSEAHGDADVLISAETLTVWLVVEKESEGFFAFLAEARRLDRVRCVWTVRRFDEVIASLYLQPRFGEVGLADPATLMEEIRAEHLFARMLEAEQIIGDAAYVKYDAAGRHQAELLRAFGLPVPIVGAIARELDAAARLRVGLSHKQTVAIRNLEALSARLGLALDRGALVGAFSGGFRFADDRACELVAPEVRRGLHERMLAAARECRFEPYGRFFGNDAIGAAPSVVGADADAGTNDGLDALTDEDLSRLGAYLQQPVEA